MKKWYILVYGNGNRTMKGIVEAEHEPTWDDLEYDKETRTYFLKEDVKSYEIRELTAPDGAVWEVKIFSDSPECEVRVKGSEEWKDAIWSIFCENIGVDTDCLA